MIQHTLYSYIEYVSLLSGEVIVVYLVFIDSDNVHCSIGHLWTVYIVRLNKKTQQYLQKHQLLIHCSLNLLSNHLLPFYYFVWIVVLCLFLFAILGLNEYRILYHTLHVCRFKSSWSQLSLHPLLNQPHSASFRYNLIARCFNFTHYSSWFLPWDS